MSDILILSLPLAQDGLRSDSLIWRKFQDIVIDKKHKLKHRDCVLLAQSFSLIEKPVSDQISNEFWKMIHSKFTDQLNEYPGDLQVIAGICFALENTTESFQLTDPILNKLQREIKKSLKELNEPGNLQFKEIVQSFFEVKSA